MPPPVGRPKSERTTRGVRIYDDTAEMLGWIIDLEGQGETFADFIEELIRREVENRFAPLRPRVLAIEAARAGTPDPAFANSLDPTEVR